MQKLSSKFWTKASKETGLGGKFITLTTPNDLEDQMIADGHSQLLRDILAESCGPSVLTL